MKNDVKNDVFRADIEQPAKSETAQFALMV